ncbi:MAG: acyltransferase [Deltaproteobacteria bacterium]|nr:MAG: acyltransferase [Deltaproteobacteria bacterium]
MAALDRIVDDLLLRVRRGDSAAARAARDVYRWALRWNMPDTRLTRPLFAALYRAHDGWIAAREFAAAKLLIEPMVRARFDRVGARLHVTSLPYVVGHARIVVGDDCHFGLFSVKSGRFCDRPELIFGNRVSIGHGVRFVVNRRVAIGDRVGIAADCWIGDSDAHPTDPDARAAGVTELRPDDIRPVRIEDDVWLGIGAKVLKGATIGRAAVVAAGSVVTGDVPAGALAMGVPARILKRPW